MTLNFLSSPEPLGDAHDLFEFSCGEKTLDDWLRSRALKNEVRGASRTYVVCEEKKVVAYYTLAVGSVDHAFSPAFIKRNMPDPVPVMIIARLAVDQRYAGQHLGSLLLQDAFHRTIRAAHIAGIKALMVHALHHKAAEFYTRWGFRASVTDPLRLYFPLTKPM